MSDAYSQNLLQSIDAWKAIGAGQERERIIKLLDGFWCGEPACEKHPVRMDWVLAAIKKESDEA